MHNPTRRTKQQVILWCRNGIPRQLIAESLDISYQTLMKYYRTEIHSGETNATNKVANELYLMATGENFRRSKYSEDNYRDIPSAVKLKAIMFWLEKRGGQSWKPTAQIPYLKTLAEIKEEDVVKEATDSFFNVTIEPRPYEKGTSKYIEPPKS